MDQFDDLSVAEKRSLVDMDSTVTNQWHRLQFTQVLVSLFGEMEISRLHQLQEQLEWHHLSNGDLLFRQDDPSDGMYIVLNGRLHYTVVNHNGETMATGEVGPGETIGEFALITDERRSATVFAVRETNLVKITPERFHRFVQEYPQMMTQLTRIIVERRQRDLKQTKPSAPERLTLAIVPTGATVDAARFARELAVVMDPFGAALALDAASFNARAGHEEIARVGYEAAMTPLTAWKAQRLCE